MGKRNLFIVGESHIMRVERDLNVHHLSDKKSPTNVRILMVQMLEHLLPFLHKGQSDSIIIDDGTNDISQMKLHTTRPHDLAKKIIDASNV